MVQIIVSKMRTVSDDAPGPVLRRGKTSLTEIASEGDCSCLVLSMRHLGDAVICSGMINALHRRNPEMAIDVLGPPELEEVIRTFSSIRDYIGINIPVFRHHRRYGASVFTAVRTMLQVRRMRYDYCINLIGDIRENICGVVSGAKWNISPVWEHGHLFKRKMTDNGARWMTNCGIAIPAIYPSFYASMNFFAGRLGLQGLEWQHRSGHNSGPQRVTVALHPGASHASRVWPGDKWRRLIHLLSLRNYKIKILGAKSERAALRIAFEHELADNKVDLITEDVNGFALCLARCDALIGMDSFSVHAAHALGVPAVVLNGSADPTILTPPGSIVVSAGNMCGKYPCYYRYPCQGTESAYICVRGIEPAVVVDAFDMLLRGHRGL